MSGTVLDRINKIKDLLNRADAYTHDAHVNQAAARAELNDLAAMFGIVMPPERPELESNGFPARLPTGPRPIFTPADDPYLHGDGSGVRADIPEGGDHQ
jgi:hypothetical protein